MLTIEVVLTTCSPLHIGALSASGSAAMRGMLKDAHGWPYIPASAFKGRLRHMVERLGRGLGYSVCETHRQMCREPARACPACQVFGSSWIPGSARFPDLLLSAPEALAAERQEGRPPPASVLRYGVGISRRRRTAGDHLLYTSELFQPGASLAFAGEIQQVPGLAEAAWLAGGLQMLESLGSDRSRGLGWVASQVQVLDEDGALVALDRLKACLEAGA